MLTWMLVSAAQATPLLDYQAPASCPDANRFADEVAARLGRVVFTAEGTEPVVVRIEDGQGLRGTLAVPTGGKVVVADDCQQVFDTLVASAAVLLDVSEAPSVASMPTASEPQAPELDLLVRLPAPFAAEPAPEWVVQYESGSPIETEPFLRLTEAPELVDFRLHTRRRNTRAAVAGGVGAALFTSGLYLLPTTIVLATGTYSDVPTVVPVVTGAGTLLGGALVGLAIPPLVRSSRDRRDPSRVVSAERADALIEVHNQGQGAVDD